MSSRRGHYVWSGLESYPTIPSAPPPGPGVLPPAVAPAQPGGQGGAWLVAVSEFPKGRKRGVLWGATIRRLVLARAELGGNQIELEFPGDRLNMRVWGDPSREVDQQGEKLYEHDSTIRREIIVGSTADGLARWRFFPRGRVKQNGNRVTVSAPGIVGGLTRDRVIGPPTRNNFLGANSSFEFGNLTNWRLVGPDVTGGVVSGGVDGSFAAWVKGTPGKCWLSATGRLSIPAGTPWYGPDGIAGSVRCKLPNIGPEINDYGLVSVFVTDAATGAQIYPRIDEGDDQAVVVDQDMPRGEWLDEPLVAKGSTPQPPFSVDLHLRLYPTSTTERTYYDVGQLFINEATGTGSAIDHVGHIGVLIEDAQKGRGKSPWGVKVLFGELSGEVDTAVWPHADGTSLDEAMNGVSGVEYWDDASTGVRGLRVAKRRGSVRTDVVIQPWDLYGVVDWELDHGGQRNAIRATSAAGSVWGGADVGAVDKSQANDQVMDVVLAGPAGLSPRDLLAWAENELGTLKLLQGSVSLVVRWEVGMSLDVGDTVRVHLRGGDAKFAQWMRVSQIVPDLIGQRWVAIDAGTDSEFEGA